ncbi:MAG: hypothetical protein MZU84_03345 [Sphingobacterium sp.]|nr:hypothetical protein [Sphingobacterium sp.]
MHPKTDKDWARTLSVLLDSALMAADPDGTDPEFEQHRTALDRYSFWRAEQQGQTRLPMAAHGCYCYEEETE